MTTRRTAIGIIAGGGAMAWGGKITRQPTEKAIGGIGPPRTPYVLAASARLPGFESENRDHVDEVVWDDGYVLAKPHMNDPDGTLELFAVEDDRYLAGLNAALTEADAWHQCERNHVPVDAGCRVIGAWTERGLVAARWTEHVSRGQGASAFARPEWLTFVMTWTALRMAMLAPGLVMLARAAEELRARHAAAIAEHATGRFRGIVVSGGARWREVWASMKRES